LPAGTLSFPHGYGNDVKIEVIPCEAKAGEFGVRIDRDAKSEAFFVGSRSEAEREAQRRRKAEDHG
jgi:hypothetical protein